MDNRHTVVFCGVVRVSLALATLTLILFVAGCSGSGEGLDVNGRPIGEGGGQQLPAGPSFASLQQNVFTPTCALSGCHSGSAAPMGLRLEAGLSYSNLVGVASVEQPSIQRVARGDPDNSYVVQKIEGIAAVGSRMPIGQAALSQSTIDFVRAWIADGAAESSGATQ